MSSKKDYVNPENLEKISGGIGQSSSIVIVKPGIESYLELKSQPQNDNVIVIANKLYPGYKLFTYGANTNGTGPNNTMTTYLYASFNGDWGWVDASGLTGVF